MRDPYRTGFTIRIFYRAVYSFAWSLFPTKALPQHQIIAEIIKNVQIGGLQNHIGNYCNQFELKGQTRLPVASFIPTLNSEEPKLFKVFS